MMPFKELYSNSSLLSCGLYIYLIVYAIFKFIHTCIPLFCAVNSGAVNGSHSFIHQLFFSFLNTLSSPVCFDGVVKFNTCRGGVLA